MKAIDIINQIKQYQDYDVVIKTEYIYDIETTSSHLEQIAIEENLFNDFYDSNEIKNFNIEIDNNKKEIYLIIYEVYCDVYNEDDPADAWFFED